MFYKGSRLLEDFTTLLLLPLDQINFITGEFAAFLSGLFFRSFLKPCPENTLKRHVTASFIGISISYFCFGSQIIHLIVQSIVTYLALLYVPRSYVHLVVFGISIGHLSGLHIYRLIYDYGNYTVEITGALMITTQKVSSLAFSYHDGMKEEESLTETQKKNYIKSRPNIIEFLSYMFNFQTILIGPLVFYKDYQEFITGENILKHKAIDYLNGNGLKSNGNGYHVNQNGYNRNSCKTNENGHNSNGNGYIPNGNGYIPNGNVHHSNGNGYHANSIDKISDYIEQPDNRRVILEKFGVAVVIALIYHNVTVVYHVKRNLDPDILSMPILYRLFFHYITVTGQRFKYYLAWQITDIVNNASGLGFNGYDENKNPKWDLCTSVNILKIETSTSVKVLLDNWNMTTQRWFKFIGYERMPTGKTLGVFVLSALWHGFYPGYYLSFVTCALLIYAGRGIRQNVRPYFQRNKFLSIFYSIITWFGAVWSLNYAATSFVLLEFNSSIQFYNSWCWITHVFAISCIILLPYKRKLKA